MKFINILKEAMDKKPKLVVLCLVLILFIVILLLYRIADKYLNLNTKVNENIYTFVTVDEPYKIDSTITINKKGVISNIDANIELTSPLYTSDKIIFPKKMLLTLPDDGYKEFYTPVYSYIKGNTLVSKDFNGTLDNYFLYDLEGLFFFPNAGTLYIDNSPIKLDKNTYVLVSYDEVSYFNYKANLYKRVNKPSSLVYKSLYKVDLLNKTVGEIEALISPNLLGTKAISEYK